MTIDRSEIYRYLGYRGSKPDETVCALAEDCLAELQQAAAPRFLSREFPLVLTDHTVQIAGHTLQVPSLAAHLQGCSRVLLMAATLGAPVDLLLARYSRTDMGRAVVLQACAAAMIEAFCDERCAGIETAPLHQRPRYSPGYGSFPLACQNLLLTLLEAPKRIGLSCTESSMLTPQKSVTAVIGLAESASCHVEKCRRCENTHCPFRKE